MIIAKCVECPYCQYTNDFFQALVYVLAKDSISYGRLYERRRMR